MVHLTWLIIHKLFFWFYNRQTVQQNYENVWNLEIWMCRKYIGLYRENAIAIESEAKDPFGGNVYYDTMQITLPIPDLL